MMVLSFKYNINERAESGSVGEIPLNIYDNRKL